MYKVLLALVLSSCSSVPVTVQHIPGYEAYAANGCDDNVCPWPSPSPTPKPERGEIPNKGR